MKYLIVLLLMFMGHLDIQSSPPQSKTVWTFESGQVRFKIRNAGLWVKGSFGKLKAQIRFLPDQPEQSRMLGQVETSSIETGISLRDKHLRDKAYFHVAQYPEIRMELLSLSPSDQSGIGLFRIRMKGTSREVRVPIRWTRSGDKWRLSAEFTLNRLDFGVGSDSWTLSDEVYVEVQCLLRPESE